VISERIILLAEVSL